MCNTLLFLSNYLNTNSVQIRRHMEAKPKAQKTEKYQNKRGTLKL